MPKEHICDLCNKIFTQKSDYDKHKKKKSPCISLTELKKITEKQTITNNIENELSTILKNCLNIMRNEGLTGEKALRNLSYFLILKLLEPQFSNNVIKINDYDYDFDDDEEKEILFKLVFFSNLNEEKEDNIKTNLKVLWEKILSVHPSTNKIFKPDKSFDIKQQANYKNIIKELSKINLSNINFDVLGNAYENVIKDIMTGKVLGQFFTPSPVKKLMIDLIDPKLSDDGNIESCCDPTMGTGGFLIEYIRTIQKQAKTKNIELDWENNIKKKIYGKEIESDTYQLAVSNMLISTGYMFNKLKEGDSIRNPITKKFSSVLANPPYGIKGLKYDDITENRDEHFPIKTDNAVSLFIQTIINMLKINGKCAVVLPDGQDLFSKSKNYVLIREYLMKTCDLKKIIYLPAGIFEHTSIKTCVFFFIKKKEGTDILKTDIKVSKTQKEIGRTYKFSKTHQTTSVKFCEYNQITTEQHLLVDVPIDKIANNSYSLNYAEYMKDETEEIEYDEGIVVKTLGEVCKLLPKSKRNAKYGNKEGLYPFFKSSTKVDSYIDEPDYTEESLIIGDGGEANINYGIKFSTSDHCYILQNKNKLLLNLKYAYYYLYHNLDMMKQLYTGVGIKNISKTNIEGIKIPIPSLERQKEIVKYLDFIYEKTNKTSNDKITELKQLNEFCLNNQKIFGDNIVKKLGEICNVNQGTYITKDMKIQGNYPVYGGGNISSYINQYNREDEIIVAKDGVSVDCVRYEKNKFFLNHHGWTIICKDEIIKKFMFYYLQTIQPELLSIAKGTAQLGINQENFYKLKIPIPSLERQQEIVEYCEYNDTLIKQLEKEIKNNKNQAKLFINSIVKKHTGSLVQNTTVNDSDNTDEESDHNTVEDHLLDTDVENPIIEQNIYHEEITEVDDEFVDELITKESDEDSD
jgi:type I restriction-modification system DNA methylase subunit/restriction endonuclease S subunit